MLDPDFDPYEIMESHAQAIHNLINAVKNHSDSQLKASEAYKELSHSVVRIYTEMKQLDHRIKRLERAQNAFEQTPTNDRPKR